MNGRYIGNEFNLEICKDLTLSGWLVLKLIDKDGKLLMSDPILNNESGQKRIKALLSYFKKEQDSLKDGYEAGDTFTNGEIIIDIGTVGDVTIKIVWGGLEFKYYKAHFENIYGDYKKCQ